MHHHGERPHGKAANQGLAAFSGREIGRSLVAADLRPKSSGEARTGLHPLRPRDVSTVSTDTALFVTDRRVVLRLVVYVAVGRIVGRVQNAASSAVQRQNSRG